MWRRVGTTTLFLSPILAMGLNTSLSDQTPRSKRRAKLEACVGDVESAVNAMKGGVDRVELCDNLKEGGTTPSFGAIAAASKALHGSSTRLHVLVRPRAGDFCYSEREVQVMLEDIRAAKMLGAHGVVVGALNTDGSIDEACVQRMVAAAKPMSVTFHRAFDLTRDPLQAAQRLIELGVDYLLTSGGQPSAVKGAETLRQLHESFGDRLTVIAAAGVSHSNAVELMERAGISEVHMGSALQETIPSPMMASETSRAVSMGTASDEWSRKVTSRELSMKAALSLSKAFTANP